MNLLLFFSAICSSLYVSCGQISCASMATIYPPSGSPSVRFQLNGSSLQEIDSFRVLQRGRTFGEDQLIPASSGSQETLPFSLEFLLSVFPRPQSGPLDLLFLAKDTENCSQLWATIEFRAYDPSVSDIVPSSGQEGTIIRLGVGSFPPFDGDDSSNFTVLVGGEVAPFVLKESRVLAVQAPRLPLAVSETSRHVSMAIETQYGTQFALGEWKYLRSGQIISVSPTSGQNGTLVNISGTDLLGSRDENEDEDAVRFFLQSVFFGNRSIPVVNYTDTWIQVRVDSSDPGGPADVTLATVQTISDQISVFSGEGPSTEANSSWTQLADGRIEEVVPPHAQANSFVHVCGRRLLGGGRRAAVVKFGDAESRNASDSLPAPSWIGSGNDTECLKVLVPSIASAADLSISITSDTGAVVHSADSVFFRVAGVSAFDPSYGQYGTLVNITGTALDQGTRNISYVSFDSVQCTVLDLDRVDYNWISVLVSEAPSPVLTAPANVSVAIGSSFGGSSFRLSSAVQWERRPSGRIAAVTPASGQAGTVVRLEGSHLLGHGSAVAAAYVADVPAEVLSSSEDAVSLRVPQAPVGAASLRLVANTGAVVEGNAQFTIREAGRILNVSPSLGQWGTRVTISGESLFGHAENTSTVTLAGIAAAIDHEASNGTVLIVQAGQSGNREQSTGQIVITATTGAVVSSETLNWTYVPAGLVNRLSPDEGKEGTVVAILGSNLLGGGTAAVAVFLNGVPSRRVVSANDTAIVVENGDLRQAYNSTRPPRVYVQSDTGAVTVGPYFVQLDSGVVTRLTPSSGAEGTFVTLTGLQLFVAPDDEIAGVTIAGVPALEGSISVLNESAVTVRAGRSDEGVSGNTEILLRSGRTLTSRTESDFVYLKQGEIEGVSPNFGTEGDLVRISAPGLEAMVAEVSEVYLSSSRAHRILSSSENELLVIAGPVPAADPSGPVTVVLADGAISRGGNFTYYTNFTVSVLAGGPSGQYGTELLLSLPFSPDSRTVAFVGDVRAEVVRFDHLNATLLISAPRAQVYNAGTVDIAVQCAYGRTFRLTNGFTYNREGYMDAVVPPFGRLGTEVFITGRYLLGGGSRLREAFLAGVPAEVVSFNSSSVTLKARESVLSLSGDVLLVSDTGARVVHGDSWLYLPPGEVSGIAPATGRFGTVVTVEGVALLGGGASAVSVQLNGVEVFAILSSTDSVVVVRAGSASSLQQTSAALSAVRIQSDTGSIATSSSNSSLSFALQSSGSILSVSPANGTGGMSVVIAGEGLLGGGDSIGRVSLAGIEVLRVENFSDNQISVVSGFAPGGEAVQGTVEVESSTGAVVVLASGWSYAEDCPGGLHRNATSGSCQPCHRLCLRCGSAESTQCYLCTSDAFTLASPGDFVECVETCPNRSTANRTCVDACESDQYEDVALQSSGKSLSTCRACSSLCHPGYGCTGPSEAHCTVCSFASLRGVCVDKCPAGHYLDAADSACVECHSECDASFGCRGPLSTDCNSCGGLQMEVLSASGAVSVQCVSGCPSMYFTSSPSCRPCHEYCLDGCSGPKSSDCHGCKFATFRYPNGTSVCAESCGAAAPGYALHYRDLDGVCQPCHRRCSPTAGCRGPSERECQRCAASALELEGACLPACPSGHYNSSGTCLPCHPACGSDAGCVGPGPEGCSVLQVAAFEAGSGTVVFVVLIIAALLLAVAILLVVVVYVCRHRSGKYSVKAEVQRALRPVRRTFSGSNHIKRRESIKLSLSRSSSILRRDAIVISHGQSDFINPLIHDEVVNQDTFTGAQFVVHTNRRQSVDDRARADLLSQLSEGDKESNPYQEIPIVEAEISTPQLRDPERVTIGSQRERAESRGDEGDVSGAESDDFVLKIQFEPSDQEDEEEDLRYASPRATGSKPTSSTSQPSLKEDEEEDLRYASPRATGSKPTSSTSQPSLKEEEDAYCNMEGNVQHSRQSSLDTGLSQYDSPKRTRQRTLSTGVIQTLSTGGVTHSLYDTPQSRRHRSKEDFRYDTPSSARLSGVTHPYATPTRPLRRKSVSGALSTRVYQTPPPRLRAASPEEHVYATVNKLEEKRKSQSDKLPRSEKLKKGKDSPGKHNKDSPLRSRKASGPQDSPVSSGLKKFFSLTNTAKAKSEARAYEIPHPGSTSSLSPPLPPIPVPSVVEDGSEDYTDDPFNQPTERIYEETFAAFDSDFSTFTFAHVSDTPPALPERRVHKTSVPTPAPSTPPLTTSPALSPTAQDVEADRSSPPPPVPPPPPTDENTGSSDTESVHETRL